MITWRLWADPASHVVAGNPDDADLFAWYMRYAATAVAHGRIPSLVTTALNSPQGVSLMWNSSMLLPCTLLAPVTLLAGPQVSLTLLTTVGFTGSAAAMFVVLRRWRVSAASAALAGAVYGFSPALLHSAIGHYDLQLAILPPLIIDAGLRVVIGQPALGASAYGPGGRQVAGQADGEVAGQADGEIAGGESADGPIVDEVARELASRPDRPSGPDTQKRPPRVAPHVLDVIRLGLLVAAELFISEELALTTALVGLLLVAGLAAGFPAMAVRRVGQAAAGLLVAACLTLALTGWALWTQFAGPLTQSGSPFTADFYENDLTGFITPSSYLLFHTSASAAAAARYQGMAPEYLAYLGWPLIITATLAAVLFAARPVVRALAVTTIVLVVLSLGGHPLISGRADVGVTLPWRWIEGFALAGSALPDRLSVLIDGMLAALLAICIDLARARMSERANLPERADLVERADLLERTDLPRRARLRPSALTTRPAVLAVGPVLLAVLACLPLLPRPLPAAAAAPLPAGWSTVLGALRLPEGARVLVVPVPEVHLTAPMRWQADTSQQYSMIGGYFIGPAWNGHAYIDGNGLAPTAAYLDRLWFAGLRPGSASAEAVAAANLGPPGAAPSAAQVRADLAAWRPAAVLANATGGTALARYLVSLFGSPSVQSGDVLAWRLR